MRVQENDFNIIYRPDKISSVSMARKLCTENSEILGVTQESFPVCVERVGEYLIATEQQFVSQRTVSVSNSIKTYS